MFFARARLAASAPTAFAFSDLLMPSREGASALSSEEQDFLTDTIFGRIKSGLSPDVERFSALCEELYGKGCERIILGCTELSLIKKESALPNYVIDSLEVLCISALKVCQKTPTGFDDNLMKLYYSEKGN